METRRMETAIDCEDAWPDVRQQAICMMYKRYVEEMHPGNLTEDQLRDCIAVGFARHLLDHLPEFGQTIKELESRPK